jgi:hypothetical protein
VTPGEARTHLQRALRDEIPEERGPLFPAWPWRGHRPVIEARAAGYAAATRREHIGRLLALSDRQLVELIGRGWDPRDRGHQPSRDPL